MFDEAWSEVNFQVANVGMALLMDLISFRQVLGVHLNSCIKNYGLYWI